MESSLAALMALSFFLGAGCWLVFLWASFRGEFDDPERPKYRMLDAPPGPAEPEPGKGECPPGGGERPDEAPSVEVAE
jgi:cbb3-type cytochrome oxidase maturation protein